MRTISSFCDESFPLLVQKRLHWRVPRFQFPLLVRSIGPHHFGGRGCDYLIIWQCILLVILFFFSPVLFSFTVLIFYSFYYLYLDSHDLFSLCSPLILGPYFLLPFLSVISLLGNYCSHQVLSSLIVGFGLKQSKQ